METNGMTKRAALGMVAWALAGCLPPVDVLPQPEPRSEFMDPRVAQPAVHVDGLPPISGGTLTVLPQAILVSDPDRDRIVVVDRVAGVVTPATLPAGSEPGRIAVDGGGRAHVVLRGSGEVYSFSLDAPAAGTRREVCPMPRGIVWDPATDAVHVACRGGELVTLPVAGGPASRTVQVPGGDLRDLVIDRGHLYASRFRAAELVEIDPAGAVVRSARPTEMEDSFSGHYENGVFVQTVFRPAVAWRAVGIPGGGVAMVHQRASDAELQTAPGAYYTSGLCNGSIVQTAVTFFDGMGTVSDAPNLQEGSVTVDVAVSADGRVAVANAGNQAGRGSVVIHERPSLDVPTGRSTGTCISAAGQGLEVPNAMAVAFDETGVLYAQERDPARIVGIDPSGAIVETIELGGEARFDTGHAIFHGNAGRGTACASCHPEGGDDGRVWQFADMGPRRTPALHAGITQTAPFHWSGDLADMRALMDAVFTGRMSGPELSDTQVSMLGSWLDGLPPPVVQTTASVDAIDRGRAVFSGAGACASCHSGALLTNNQTVDVGTGAAFQVPSLVGLADRLPVMHDGCAVTLERRFDPACGGASHGGALDAAQRADLVAFLSTL